MYPLFQRFFHINNKFFVSLTVTWRLSKECRFRDVDRSIC